MRLDELDGLHFPLTAMVPRVGAPPAVVTAHDVQHLVYRNSSRTGNGSIDVSPTNEARGEHDG